MDDNSELHVVFGASGSIGGGLVRELAKRGKRVRAVNRTGKAELPASVEVIKGDASNLDSARQACQGAGVVYHCVNLPYEQWSKGLPLIMDNIIEATATAGAKLVFADNLYVYGTVQGPMTENLPLRPATRKGRIRSLLAYKLIEAEKKGKLRSMTVRASDFYGPGVLNSVVIELVFKPMLAGKKAMWLGSLDAPHSMSYTEDVARGIAMLVELDSAFGQVWFIPAGEPFTGRLFIEMAFKEAGLPPKMGVHTAAAMSMAGIFSAMIREETELLYQFEKPFVMDTSKFMREFPDFLPTPPQEAMKKSVQWFREQNSND
jgi:nucleoside-diphosphate-sugar epimerase